MGCSGGGAAPKSAQFAAESHVAAHWDYLEAAVIYAAAKEELAILRTRELSEGDALRREYVLVTLRDAEMVVDVRGDDVDGVARVTEITARLTPFRDAQREDALVRAIENRLAKLERGGGIAPG